MYVCKCRLVIGCCETQEHGQPCKEGIYRLIVGVLDAMTCMASPDHNSHLENYRKTVEWNVLHLTSKRVRWTHSAHQLIHAQFN